MSDMMMKLIVLAAALTAVAFAAPRSTDSFAHEETTLVQTQAYQASINGLKKQFSELQVSLKDQSYMQVTPGVKSTIDKMVKLIESDIEPAINDAHRADQALLDTEMGKIQTYRDAVFAQQEILYAKADEIRGWITEHNKLVIEWDARAEKFIAARDVWTITHNNKTTTCCAKDNAAVVDVAYLEPYHQCDFKAPEADECISKATNNVHSYVEPYFTNGFNHYLELVRNCDFLGNLTVAKHQLFTAADEDCDNYEEKTRSKADLIATETATFEHNWATLRDGYRTNITIMEDEYTGKEAQVKSDEADRKNEWESTQIIKCMLVNYKAGGGFDDASLSKCKDASGDIDHLVIVYPAMVERITWILEEFEALTEYQHDQTCHEVVVQENPVCEVHAQKAIPECSNHM
jgi:hypothetical protein